MLGSVAGTSRGVVDRAGVEIAVGAGDRGDPGP